MKRLCCALLASLACPVLHADTVVVFNEIMYHPATNEPAAEWVEFYNQMAVDVDISDWEITGGINYTFPEGTVVGGGDYLVVAIDPTAFQAQTGISGALGPFTGRLSNNGENLRLRNNSRRVVDEVRYGVDGDWPVAPDGAGVSLSKKVRDTASGPAENWTWSDQKGGSPGQANFPFLDSTPPPVEIIGSDAVWSFEDSGTDLGSAWTQLEFDDSAWGSGQGWFYHGSIAAGESRPVPTLFNTGVGADGNFLSPGDPDPHYVITAAAQGSVGAQATVMQNNPAWIGNSAVSAWIGVVNSGNVNVADGDYHFLTSFSLEGFMPETAVIRLRAAVDNNLNDVLVNGVSSGVTHSGFNVFSGDLILNSGFVAGSNSLEFLTDNVNVNPGGFRAELEGTAFQTLTNTPVAAAPNTHYLRRTFQFLGDPSNVELTLNALVDDGAVFYLNGTEIARLNMPDGPVSFNTPAASNILDPVETGLMVMSAASLREGENVLAAEVHQAAGGEADMVFSASLFARQLPPPPIPLALNEVAGVANETFFVELANLDTNQFDLTGFVLERDGLTNETFVFSGAYLIPPNGYLAVTGAELGFDVRDEDRLVLWTPGKFRVLDATLAKNSTRGRYPDRTGRWLRPSLPTPGMANQFTFRDNIVINEIMYHPPLLPPGEGGTDRESPEAWIEFYNKGTAPVDLTGWELDGGVSFAFPLGSTIGPGDYLIVADDAAFLRAKYPALTILGDLGGRLSGKSDLIVLKDSAGNPADEVRYFEGGAWPRHADGGGSSLELRDALADNTKAAAWTASDESAKVGWQTYSYRMTADNEPNNQPTRWQDFVLGLLGAGECLIDDVSVIESPAATPVQVISNGDFENELSGWRAIGNHGKSHIVADPDNPANNVLRLVATGPQEHMHNHLETTLADGRSIVDGREYEISFKARWVTGINLVNTRLYFNRAAQTTALPIPDLLGTPGAPNSALTPNQGPTMDQLEHRPAVPQPGQPVTVSIAASDPQGIASVVLRSSVNGGPWTSTAMSETGPETFAGTIPGALFGDIVQFYVTATDSLGASADFPADGPDSGALFAVEDGQSNLALGHNIRIILTPDNTSLLHASTNVMSNGRLPGTVIYDEQRPYYNVGVRLKSSQRGRDNPGRVGFHLTFPPEDLFRGVHPVMLVDRGGGGGQPPQEEIVIKHMLINAGGIPGVYSDISRVIAPRSAQTGPSIFFPRYEDEFVETAFSNGGDGTLYELELTYFPTTANSFGYKNPQPDSVVAIDFQDLGDNKEIYRYNFIRKNRRAEDDFGDFIAFAKTFSLMGDQLEQQAELVMDVDQWMRGYALVSLCAVGDMYTYGLPHNWMVYQRPSDAKFLYFPWDMDFSFTRGTTAALIGNSPSSDSRFRNIVLLPPNLRRFYGHIKDIINKTYNSTYMNFWLSHYDDFAPGQDYSGRASFIDARASYALGQINGAGGNAAFAVTGDTAFSTDKNLVTLSGTAPVDVQSILVNGVPYPVTWTSVAAWTLQVPLVPGTNNLELVGLDVRGEPLTNFTAGLTVDYTGTLPEPDDFLVLNEIMYNPAQPGAAYVEILNTSDSVSFDISGWKINGVDYEFPGGSFITNGQQLAIVQDLLAFARAYGTDAPEPFGFFDGRLDLDGETLTLQKPVTQILTNDMGLTETNTLHVDVDKVRYEPGAPWNAAANGGGAALQLIDPLQDNSRVSNWSDGRGWRQLSFTAVPGPRANRFFLWLQEAGELFIDNVQIVEGDVAGAGPNVLLNGGFESGDLTDWNATGNHDGSAVTSEVAFEGTYSLKVVATGAGSAASAIWQSFASLVETNSYTLSFYFLPDTAELLNYRVSSFFRTLEPLDVVVRLATPGFLNTSSGILPAYDALWLNETLPVNSGGLLDVQGEAEPWIELFNAGSTPVSLDNYFLADHYDGNLAQWPFPAGSQILPGEFKVIFTDGEPGESTAQEWHTNFRPAGGSGRLALVRQIDGPLQITDYLNYTNLLASQSYGDFPDGQPFKRAVFTTPTPGAANRGRPANVFINEWLAGNQTSLADPADGNFEDWFELYNADPLPVDLTGFFLTDNPADKTQFHIPAGFVVPGNGYLLVWADNSPEQNTTNSNQLHVNFALNRDGESIGLYSPDRIAVDEITFGIQSDEISEGRFPDGASEIFELTPTPLAANVPLPDTGAPEIMNLELSPAGQLTFSFMTELGKVYRVDYKNDLNDFQWTPLTLSIPGTGAPVDIIEDTSLLPRRFYRVTVLE